MREIKFRGQDETGKWFYGSLLAQYTEGKIKHATIADNIDMDFTSLLCGEITVGVHCVEGKTIGMYIGLKDKEGTEIYEGDILRCCDKQTDLYCDYNVVFDKTQFQTRLVDGLGRRYSICDVMQRKKYAKVIGNIHDNPELMKGGMK